MHLRDIAAYVRSHLAVSNESMVYNIIQKASGVFMRVVLVVTMVNKAYDKGKIEAMYKTLEEVPDELKKLFWAILCQDNLHKHQTVLMLQ